MWAMMSRGAVIAVAAVAVAACGGSGPGGGGGAPGPHPYLAGRAMLSWGANDAGQLGDGGNAQRLAPGPGLGKDNIRALAAGGNRSLALLTDGTVWEWGAGRTVPAQVPGLASVTAIAAGGMHALALTSDHRVYAWGANDAGQLGDNSTMAHSAPVLVNNLTDAVAVAAGRAHSIAIRADLSVVAWGANNRGQLGDGTTTSRLTPVAVPNVTAVEVAAGADTTVAATASGAVAGWGANNECQLGLNPPASGVVFTPRCDDSPAPLSLGGDVTASGHAIAVSAETVLIRTAHNTVDALGGLSDHDPACGTDTLPWSRGRFMAAPPDVVAITSGLRHSLMLTATGQVLASGADNAGQLGSGTASTGHCLVPVAGLAGATAVAAGDSHSLAAVAGVPSLSPASPVVFPGTPVGSSATRTITLTNSGMAPLSLYSFAASGDFQISSNQCPDFHASLAPGSSCLLDVVFAPAASGVRTGTLTIGHDATGRTLVAGLTGSGREPKVVFTPGQVDFGTQAVGTTSPARTVTLRNDGDADLTVNTVTALAGFDVAGSGCLGSPVAAGGGTCTIDVTFSPLQARLAGGQLRVAYDGNKTAYVELSGTGIAPSGTISPAGVAFPPTTAGSNSQPEALTVTSTGSLPLDIAAAAVTGDFQIDTDDCASKTLSPGSTCTIKVLFSPTATGSNTGRLTVPTNGLPPTLDADLAGIGT